MQLNFYLPILEPVRSRSRGVK